MKNLLKVVAVAFVMLFGISTMNAQGLTQDQDRPEVVAKKMADHYSKQLGLNGDQQRALFRAYTAKEAAYRKHVTGKDLTDPTVTANKKKYDKALYASVKKALTDEQYKKWLELQKF